jgi:hypothetical protein
MPISKIKAGGISDDAVTTAKIVDGTVAAVDIADGAVTSAKLDTNIDIDGTLDVTSTLTADGNLLVGKTSAGFANTGHEMRSGGSYAAFTRDGGPAVLVNRKTSDGDMIEFMEGGTTRGSIGNLATTVYIETKSQTGLGFYSGHISPRYNSAAADATADLGRSSQRFKDLYLSGGAYIGGTTSANYLDDYEEGTHQTSVTMSGSGTVTLNTSFDRFSYTKVGRLVTITGNPRISSVSSPVGNLQLTLPFTAVAGQTDECRSGGVMRYYDNSAGVGSYSKPMAWSIQEGASTLLIDNTNTNGNNLTPAASDEFYLSISYMTN